MSNKRFCLAVDPLSNLGSTRFRQITDYQQSFKSINNPFSLATIQGICRCKASALFSFPLGTEMFHFPRFARAASGAQRSINCVRFPHSEIPGSQVACHFPEAYRRLLRPSSPFGAKASTICPIFSNSPFNSQFSCA